jgi:uncharacterized membrane protein
MRMSYYLIQWAILFYFIHGVLLGQWRPLGLILMSFLYVSVLFEHFHALGTTKYSRIILDIPALDLESVISLNTLLLRLEKEFIIQSLGSWCAYSC